MQGGGEKAMGGNRKAALGGVAEFVTVSRRWGVAHDHPRRDGRAPQAGNTRDDVQMWRHGEHETFVCVSTVPATQPVGRVDLCFEESARRMSSDGATPRSNPSEAPVLHRTLETEAEGISIAIDVP